MSAAAKIFLADERRKTEDSQRRSYYTFNYDKFFNPHKEPFEGLYAFNEETLASQERLRVTVPDNSFVIILPVVGSINCSSTQSNSTINPGQLLFIHLKHNESFAIANPYDNNLVNFLQILIKAPKTTYCQDSQLFNFNLDTDKNRLVKLTAPVANNEALLQPLVSIGNFKGREEAVYELKSAKNNLFVFVIEGVFEVQNRLLHQRDGLGLWDTDEPVELEALSNDAIILMIEFS